MPTLQEVKKRLDKKRQQRSQQQTRQDPLRGGMSTPEGPVYPQQPSQKQDGGFVSNVVGDIKEAGQEIGETFRQTARGDITPVETGIQTVGSVIGAAGDVGFEGLKAVTPDPIEKAVGQGVQSAVQQTPIPQLAQRYQQFAQQNPRAARNIGALGNIASIAPVGKGAQLGARGVKAGAKRGMRAGSNILDSVKKTTPQTTPTAPATTAKQATKAAEPTGAGALGRSLVERGGKFIERTKTRTKEAADRAKRLEQADPTVKQAVQVGIPEPEVYDIMRLSKNTAKKGKEILDTYKKVLKRPLTSRKDPKEVLGDEILKPVKILIDKKKEIGNRLGEVKKQIFGENIDLNNVYRDVMRDIQEMTGAKIRPDGVSLRGGRLRDRDRNLLEDLLKTLSPQSKRSGSVRRAEFVDNNRGRLFDKIRGEKLKKEPYATQAETIVDNARKKMAQAISQQTGTPYAQISQEFASVLEALKGFTDLIRYKGKLRDLDDSALRAAERSLGILGNAAGKKRPVIRKMIQKASEFGYESSDIESLIRLYDSIEGLLGSTKTRSLQGQVGRGTAAGTGSAVGEALSGGGGLTERALQMVSKVGGVSDDDVIDALENLLEAAINKN